MAIASQLCRRSLLNRLLTYKNNVVVCRNIQTTKKKKDEQVIKLTPEVMRPPIPDFSKPSENKNWVSFGFSYQSRVEDIHRAHFFMFCGVTIILVFSTFYFYYSPDLDQHDWCAREAFIKLRERELAGLPPIDINYVDPDQIVLPSDEELGDTPIII